MRNKQQRSRPYRRVSDAASRLAAILLMCLALGASADERDRKTDAADSEATKEEVRCVHGCQRWGKVCNVDPRGAYKCRRRCEKFGKICE